VTLLHQAGLLGWQLDVEVVLPTGRYRLDLAFVRERIAVEVDGWAWHSTSSAFALIGGGRTRWSLPAGPSCGSPGTT